MGLPAADRRRSQKIGKSKARLAPPMPARSLVKELQDTADVVGHPLWPWQVTAGRYIQARGPDSWQWPEVAVLVARQNGKTQLLETLILTRLRMGQRVMHTAQNRTLPRESFDGVIDALERYWPELKPRARRAQGQEHLTLTNGGAYHIVAPTRSGARGHSNDLVLIDEVLDLDNLDFISAAKPTIMASSSAQIVYFSNAGTPDSVVLNSLKARADNDSSLAYLEWSAPADADPGGLAGWLQANPAVGHNPAILPNLEREYQAHLLGGTMEVWEREYLCRWTPVTGSLPFIEPAEWMRQDFNAPAQPGRFASMGIKSDPNGTRCSAVVAWPQGDGVALAVVADVTGSPIDAGRLGPELMALATRLKCRQVAYDPWTDADLARFFRKPQALGGRDFAAASDKFVKLALARQLAVNDPQGILATDLDATVRVGHTGGTFMAAKSSPDLSNTAAEAAIRAVWMASAPQPRVMVY
jgi:hypothetical protein